jgi:4-amino-4-deoxy-L-arabinose transferase-like glycosyltransferase
MPEKTTNARDSKWYVLALFAFAVVLLYLFALDVPLLGPDEPRYAQVAREMYARGDWVTPTLGGANWFEKPVLLYWLQIVSYHVFGVGEFAARFGSAVLGLLTIFCMWSIGKVIDSDDVNRGLYTHANLLAFISASTLGLIVFSRGASFDIVVTFTITASLTAFFIAEQSAGKLKRTALLGMYVFLGLGLLAKGLVGVIFPAAIIFSYFLVKRRLPARSLMLSSLWGMPVTILVAGLWYFPMYMRHGWSFIDEFFIQHHFQRFTSNKYQHPQPFYFYFWVLPLMTLPWLPFAVSGVWKAIRAGIRASGEMPNAKRDLSILGLCWVVVPTVFFSFSGSKLPGYILPAVPGAICLAGILCGELSGKTGRWRNIITATGLTTLGLILLALIFAFPKFAEKDSVRPLTWASASLGYGDLKVYPLRTLSHNAEFYAAQRLPRTIDGEQRRFESLEEIVGVMRAEQETKALILTPVSNVDSLRSRPDAEIAEIANNGKLAIAAVTLK